MRLSAQKVVARFVLANDIPLGVTREFGSVRVHRYADHFKVTDLTFAGKRGKKVRVMNLSPTYQYKGKPADWMERMSTVLPDYPGYDKIRGLISDLLHDFPGEINMQEFEVRGVDVNPGGTEKIELANANGIRLTALPDNFTLVSSWKLGDGAANDSDEPSNQQDTLYYPVGKRDAMVFYNWLKANRLEAQKMTIEDFRKLWQGIGVKYDHH
jgi:hypothetical protein